MNKKVLFSLFVFLSSFIYFAAQLAPTVIYGDSAELVIGAYKLTIVHPSGYPLYLLFGKLFTFIPIGDIGYRINLMSAFFGALTCSFVFLILLDLAKSLFISLISTFTLVFSFTFSFLSTIAEVYTLNSFFFALLIYILIQWKRKGEKKFLFLFSFLLGLSLTNHLTILIFFPSFLIYFLLEKSKIPLKLLDLAKIIAFFTLGLLPYLYIPIFSFLPTETIFWQKIKSLREFFLFVSGSHFKVWILSQSLLEFLKSILKFISFLLIQFPGLATIFGAIGFLECRKNKKEEFILFSTMFISLFLFVTNYRIEDINHFHLPCYIIFSIWVGFGIIWLWKRTPEEKKFRKLFAFTIILLLISYPLTYEILDIPFRSQKSFYFSDTSRMGLISAEKNSVIICDWSYATLFRYWQMIYKIRRDVIVIFDYDENWIKYVDEIYGKRKIYLSRFEKGVGSKYYLIPESFLYRVEKSPPEFKENAAKPGFLINQVFHDHIVLIGYDIIKEPEERGILSINLYWKALEKLEKAYVAEIEMLDSRGKTFYFKAFRPVYGFYSTEKWKEGEILKEKLNLYFPFQSFSSFRLKFKLSIETTK